MRNRHSGGSRNPEGSTPLTLSLSKGLRGLKGWFDKLTMSGFAKVFIKGEGGCAMVSPWGEGQDEGDVTLARPSMSRMSAPALT